MHACVESRLGESRSPVDKNRVAGHDQIGKFQDANWGLVANNIA